MGNQTPSRFTPRAGSRASGAMRRALDGAIDSKRRYGDTLEVSQDGRLEIKLAPEEKFLKMTRRGLMLDQGALGDKNRSQMDHMNDLASNATAATIVTAYNKLLSEMRRTKRLKGGF